MEHWELLASGVVSTPQTAEELWKSAIEYFQWCEDNPLESDDFIRTGKNAGDSVAVKKKRPFTISALCLHCGITEVYLRDLMLMPEDDNKWRIVADRIITIVKTQVLENALQNEFSAVVSMKMLNIDKDRDTTRKKPIKVEVVGDGSGISKTEEEAKRSIEKEGKMRAV